MRFIGSSAKTAKIIREMINSPRFVEYDILWAFVLGMWCTKFFASFYWGWFVHTHTYTPWWTDSPSICFSLRFQVQKSHFIARSQLVENPQNLCSNMNCCGRDCYLIWQNRVSCIWPKGIYYLQVFVFFFCFPSGQFAICNQWGYSWLLSGNYPTAFVSHSTQLYMCFLSLFCFDYLLKSDHIFISKHSLKLIYPLFQMKFENSCVGSLVED